jgi:hypothetical protein
MNFLGWNNTKKVFEGGGYVFGGEWVAGWQTSIYQNPCDGI